MFFIRFDTVHTLFPAGDPSAKDLEKLFSLGWLSSQGSQARAPWSHSGSKSKRSSSKQEKRKSHDRKGASDSTHTHRKDSGGRLAESRDSKGPKAKEAEPAHAKEAEPAHTFTKSQTADDEPKLQRSEVIQETLAVKLHKPDSRKGQRREGAGPEYEALARRKRDNDREQDEKRRKRKSEGTDGVQEKSRMGLKHLEKTVSIRLVDIRHSDAEDYFTDEAMGKRGGVAPASAVQCSGTRANGWLKKGPSDSVHAANAPLRSWGKFRIPKRSERPSAEEREAESGKVLLRPLTNTPEAPAYPRTRLRSGSENDGYASDSKASDGDVEACLKRCHSHQLRGDSTLGRRYGSDIIRRGVLAS